MTPLSPAEYWRELAMYDLETAEAMRQTGRWLYVGFMCHQSVEKAMKSVICARGGGQPPRVHRLTALAEAAGFAPELTDAQREFLDTLEPLNIEARYPSHKERLLASLTPERCADLVERTRKLMAWIATRS